MQVDPIKPALKPHGTERLKLKYDTLLSAFAFELNLRRYSMAAPRMSTAGGPRNSAWNRLSTAGQGLTLVHFSAQRKHILLDRLGA